MIFSCTMTQIPLVIHLIMRQKGGLACANANCSHGCSLGEIITIMLCYAGEHLTVFWKKPLYDTDGCQLVILTSTVRSAIKICSVIKVFPMRHHCVHLKTTQSCMVGVVKHVSGILQTHKTWSPMRLLKIIDKTVFWTVISGWFMP